jgi:hypothetical protein
MIPFYSIFLEQQRGKPGWVTMKLFETSSRHQSSHHRPPPPHRGQTLSHYLSHSLFSLLQFLHHVSLLYSAKRHLQLCSSVFHRQDDCRERQKHCRYRPERVRKMSRRSDDFLRHSLVSLFQLQFLGLLSQRQLDHKDDQRQKCLHQPTPLLPH